MIFSFFKKWNDIAILQKAEEALKINLVDTYKKSPKKVKKQLLKGAVYYNKCHNEYLISEDRFLKKCEMLKNDKTK